MRRPVERWSVEIERGDVVSGREISAVTGFEAEDIMAAMLAGTGWQVVPGSAEPAMPRVTILFAHAA